MSYRSREGFVPAISRADVSLPGCKSLARTGEFAEKREERKLGELRSPGQAGGPPLPRQCGIVESRQKVLRLRAIMPRSAQDDTGWSRLLFGVVGLLAGTGVIHPVMK